MSIADDFGNPMDDFRDSSNSDRLMPGDGRPGPDGTKQESADFGSIVARQSGGVIPIDRYYSWGGERYTSNEWVDLLSDLFGNLLGSFYEETDAVDDIDRIYRQQEAQKFNNLLDEIRAGNASWRDLAGFEVYYLGDVDGFQEYVDDMVDSAMYTEFYEDLDNASTNEDFQRIFNEYGNAGIETNPYIQQDLASTGSATSVITGTVDNSILEAEIRKAAIGDGIFGGEVDFEDLPGYGGIWEGLIRHIKVIGKGLPLPIPDWLPLPGIFELPTVGDIFDKVTGPWKTASEDALRDCVDTGKSASQCMEEQSVIDILVDGIGNATEGVWEATSDKVNEILTKGGECVDDPKTCAQEVFDKIKDIFGEGTVDPTSTGGNIPDWMKVIIIGGAYGDEILGELEDLFGGDIDDNGTVGVGPQDPEECTNGAVNYPQCDQCPQGQQLENKQCVDIPPWEDTGPSPQECSNQNRTHVPGDPATQTISSCGDCLGGFDEVGEQCQEEEDPITNNGPTASECAAENREFNPATDVEDSSCGACLSGFTESGDACVEDTNPQQCDNNATQESGCETCADGSLPSEHQNGDCKQPVVVTQVECPQNTPKAGQMVDKLSDCGEPTNSTGYDCTQPRPEGFTFGTVAWNQNCEATHCTDGTLKDDAEGSNCPGYVAPEVTDPEPTSDNCDQQDRVTNEDGSCGECKPGFIADPQGFDQCIQAPPDCNDCSCPEYATANPAECAQCPEGQSYCESSGQCEEPQNCPGGPNEGGGGGGGGGGGFDLKLDIADIGVSGDPQLLGRQRFGAQDFVTPLFTGNQDGGLDFPIARFLQGQKGDIV